MQLLHGWHACMHGMHDVLDMHAMHDMQGTHVVRDMIDVPHVSHVYMYVLHVRLYVRLH